MFSKVKENLASQQLTMKELLSYGSGMFAIGIGGLGVSYMTYFWTDISLIPMTAVGMIMLLSRIWDGTDDILVGWIVDRTKTKYGKARPWLLRMVIPSIITLGALFYAPDISPLGKILYAFFTYNLSKLFFSTFGMLAMHSMTSLMTPSPKGRMTLSLTSQVASSLASVFGNLFIIGGIAYFGGGENGYFSFFAIIAALSGIFLLVAFFGTKEKVVEIKKQEEKISLKEALKTFKTNKWWTVATIYQFFAFMMLAFTAVNMYYMTYIMQNVALMGTFMSVQSAVMFFIPFIMSPIVNIFRGKINASLIGVVLTIIGGFLPLFNTSSVALLIACSIVRGLGLGFMFSIRFAIMADVADYGEYVTGRRTDGLVYSGISMSGKLGMGIAAALLSFLLQSANYVGGAETQVPSAVSMIIFLFTWVTVILSVLMGLCLFWLRGLEKDMPMVCDELEKRKLECKSE